MPRLFWKFFTIIWLTLAASVAVIIIIVNLLQAVPFARELEAERRALILNLAANVLAKDGEDAARHFVGASEETLPLGLTISKAAEAAACADANAANTRSVLRDGVCYRIILSAPAGSILENFAPFMPWLAILISSTISAGALAQYLIRPVVHLRDGLSALAHGRFDFRIGDKMAGRKDEVTALAHDFDSSAARLQELQDAQQRLFHDVSHELRSPLSRLQAAVGVLRQNPAKLDVMLDRMDREVERLDVLVGEILTLARLTAGSSLPLKTQSLDVVDLLNEILGDATFEAQIRAIAITASVDGMFLADVEGELIYRALENVIRNAIKYTAERSRISVRCEMTADLLKVRVTDQGPGVRHDELERIFQPFSRGNGAVPSDGYGLGLAITRQAIERHGGRAYASLPAAGGLTITLEIPRKPTTFGPASDHA
ncbi:HAMP domain-containing histidine kinase [Agrobacterium sp. SHOUNA12C]|uniref:histidine kinase n=1 Tax=Rhizobium rhizogenes NBRC 13257 TaxID=1220581 RepID=A0AA87Q2H5_RHIRH|nr:HAMP domain-containing sensor histidine kinase [Rhizobium rhizogenes]MCJ9723436.1 HAMP domain-containing histidine kinase [Agrobacterium sp. BETTINA12B]MCJ9758765.1 HAMP domain-containing histidine kinase [Agrobacterium sp. SHOUNA12C]OCI94757.1 two-component sensor histidine kinase [Agrobacterium sp. 13-626]OCJ08753.1 two-component sensor histidine kinase [Agrobacterium sp. B131/95]OCJ14141.1 two-component sensor histidine kinase [Agrobacterium sp. B133/95]